ncbi:hypothetical protein ACFL0U_03080 [Pseudomonadota bacterium]
MGNIINKITNNLGIIVYILGFLFVNIILFVPFMWIPIKILSNAHNILHAFSGNDLVSFIEMPQKYNYVFLYFIVSFLVGLILLHKYKEKINNFDIELWGLIKKNIIFSVSFTIICLLNLFINSIYLSFITVLLIIPVVIITIIFSYILLVLFFVISFKLINFIKRFK